MNTGFIDGLAVEMVTDEVSTQLSDGMDVGSQEKLFPQFWKSGNPLSPAVSAQLFQFSSYSVLAH